LQRWGFGGSGGVTSDLGDVTGRLFLRIPGFLGGRPFREH
jgi:hypothetical protein